jgi:CheY-like chemotaxis protein
MKIAALIDDLFFSSKISEVAKQTGASVVFCRRAESVPPDADRILVDLNASAFDAVEAIRRLATSHKAPITAYFSHLQAELAQRAVDAGVTEVLPRSAFVQRLPALLGRVS